MEVTVDEKNQPKEELSNVQVKLDENNQPINLEKPKDEPKYVRVEDLESINKAINNTREHSNRKISSLESKIDQLLKGTQQPQKPVNVPQDEWDKKLETDWKGTVRELARLEAEEIRKREREAEKQEAEQIRTLNLLNENKFTVIKKHKELNDETSHKAEIYRQVLTERPEYLTNPFGPVLAMRDMEDRLRESGYVDESIRPIVDKEVARQARTNGSSVPKGNSNPSSQKTITLTREQKDFCDANNIKYENFAKYSTMLNNKKEVEA